MHFRAVVALLTLMAITTVFAAPAPTEKQDNCEWGWDSYKHECRSKLHCPGGYHPIKKTCCDWGYDDTEHRCKEKEEKCPHGWEKNPKTKECCEYGYHYDKHECKKQPFKCEKGEKHPHRDECCAFGVDHEKKECYPFKCEKGDKHPDKNECCEWGYSQHEHSCAEKPKECPHTQVKHPEKSECCEYGYSEHEKRCKPKPEECPHGKKKNGECRKKPRRSCPWGQNDYDDECRKDCQDKKKCDKNWKGECKKDGDGIDIPKPHVGLPDYLPPIEIPDE